MTEAKVTNKSAALQGVRTVNGVVHIPAGKTRTLEFDDDKLERLKTRAFLTIETAPTPSPEPEPEPATDERESLKAQADLLGIEYASNIPTVKLKALVDEKMSAG